MSVTPGISNGTVATVAWLLTTIYGAWLVTSHRSDVLTFIRENQGWTTFTAVVLAAAIAWGVWSNFVLPLASKMPVNPPVDRMRDAATINEAVDLLDGAGWKGYANAVREQADEIAVLKARHDELLAALKGVVRVADRATIEFDAARAAIAKSEAGERTTGQ
jgi:hypothetical protein